MYPKDNFWVNPDLAPQILVYFDDVHKTGLNFLQHLDFSYRL